MINFCFKYNQSKNFIFVLKKYSKYQNIENYEHYSKYFQADIISLDSDKLENIALSEIMESRNLHDTATNIQGISCLDLYR